MNGIYAVPVLVKVVDTLVAFDAFATVPVINEPAIEPELTVPRLLILFVTALGNVPVILDACNELNPLPLPVIRPEFNTIVPLPITTLLVALPIVTPVSVPTEVIFGCAAVVRVPVK